jgi:hypothetical protein
MRYLAVVLLLAACAKNPTPEGPTTSCSGEQLAIVTNDWNEPVDVLARLADGGTPRTLGTVQPGSREELTLPAGSPGVFLQTTRVVQPSTEPIQMRRLVHIRYRCR